MPVLDWGLALLTLTAMEIVLGIDNIIFLAIVVGRLPLDQQGLARRLGMGLALGTRLLLLFTLTWVLGLNAPLFTLADLGLPGQWAQQGFSWRDIILITGGLFLIAKSTHEIHAKLEGDEERTLPKGSARARFGWTLAQVAILDIVFSLDSVITAVGMAQHLWIMVVAMVAAVGVMLVFAGAVTNFVQRHPTLKMLALSFLILIGVMLVAEGIEKHIERGYIYFAMTFALAVELLNLRLRKEAAPVHFHEPHLKTTATPPSVRVPPPRPPILGAIRPATVGDMPVIAGLVRDLAEYERLAHSVGFDENQFREHLFGPRPYAGVYLAEEAGAVVGFALFFPSYSTFLGKPGLYLEDLFVRPENRGRGHGSALFKAVARKAIEEGCGRLEWTVLNWNEPALRFYRVLGAVPMDEWTTYRLEGDALAGAATAPG